MPVSGLLDIACSLKPIDPRFLLLSHWFKHSRVLSSSFYDRSQHHGEDEASSPLPVGRSSNGTSPACLSPARAQAVGMHLRTKGRPNFKTCPRHLPLSVLLYLVLLALL
jgi:hypothetical protein